MKLKNLIDQHREAFDQEELPTGLWEGIQSELKETPVSKSRGIWWYSAAAALLLGAFAWWQWPSSKAVHVAPAQLPQSFLNMEEDYKQNLAQIESLLPLDEYRNEPAYAWVFEELQSLEEINAKYREDISAPVPREELLKVLIDYYEKRLRLLRKLQMEVERNQKMNKNENFSL